MMSAGSDDSGCVLQITQQATSLNVIMPAAFEKADEVFIQEGFKPITACRYRCCCTHVSPHQCVSV